LIGAAAGAAPVIGPGWSGSPGMHARRREFADYAVPTERNEGMRCATVT
jgi:hypothetical protein